MPTSAERLLNLAGRECCLQNLGLLVYIRSRILFTQDNIDNYKTTCVCLFTLVELFQHMLIKR